MPEKKNIPSKCFTERASAFVGKFRSNGPKVFIGSQKLRWFDNFSYAVSVAKALFFYSLFNAD